MEGQKRHLALAMGRMPLFARMPNITYLLGAGASYHALPVVEEFEKEIQKVIQRLTNEPALSSSIEYSGKNSCFALAYDDLCFLQSGCKSHASVDTFARKFFLTEKTSEYQRAKRAITLFFELYYFYFRKVDMRYDAFLASILTLIRPRLPNHINVISWNYDYEFERAYTNFMDGVLKIEDAYKELQVHHKGNTLPIKENEFQLVKLNGTSGYFNSDYDTNISLGLGIDSHLIYDSWPSKPSNFSVLNTVLERHEEHSQKSRDDIKPAISFAWEENSRNEVVERAKCILRKSDSVVIVGYSFPYFNRLIDRELFRAVEMDPKRLKRIYVQDPDAENVITSVKSIMPAFNEKFVKAIPITNLKQLYMPYEMD